MFVHAADGADAGYSDADARRYLPGPMRKEVDAHFTVFQRGVIDLIEERYG